jgi:hypothetical protein
VHPQQQLRIINAELLAGVGVISPQPSVQSAYPLSGAGYLLGGAEGSDTHELSSALKPLPGPVMVKQRRVLRSAANYPWVQGLQVQRTDSAHPQHRLKMHTPGH